MARVVVVVKEAAEEADRQREERQKHMQGEWLGQYAVIQVRDESDVSGERQVYRFCRYLRCG